MARRRKTKVDEQVVEEVTETITEPFAEEVQEETTPEAVEEVRDETVQEEVTETITEPVAEEVQEETTPEVVDEVRDETAQEEVTEPITVPVAEESKGEAIKKEVVTGIDPDIAEIKAMLNAKDIADLLAKPGMSVDDKLKVISEKGLPKFKTITSKLLSYNDSMGVGMIDPALGAAKQYDLANILKMVINEKDYDVFKVMFDIVNLVFINKADEGFNKYAIFRFDDKWKWNKKDLSLLQNLTILISTLAPLGTRAANIKKLDIASTLDQEVTGITAVASENIQKYYKA